MGSYVVHDINDKKIVFSEKTSIWLTLAMVINVILAATAFIITISSIVISIAVSIGSFTIFLYFLVLVFVYNHLKKGDMNVDRAVLLDGDGDVVEIRRESSIWITLATIFVGLVIIFSIVMSITGYQYTISEGIIETAKGWGNIVLGLTSIIYFGIIYAILDFLRTKINFDGENIKIKTDSGHIIELYKRRSSWITIGYFFH